MTQLPVTLRMLAQLARRSPVGGARSALIGVTAALRAPLWTSGARLTSALGSAYEPQARYDRVDNELAVALRVANGTLRHLSRTGKTWRNTCLYRSLAQYLVLRRYGRSAAVRIGVPHSSPHVEESTLKAHSWVIYHGPEPVQDGGEWCKELRTN